MGSRMGYEYRHRFSIVDEHEISVSRLTSIRLRDGARAFIFEVRTDFVVSRRSRTEQQETAARVSIDAERYEECIQASSGAATLAFLLSYRLEEYWMTRDEINLLCGEAVAFAQQMAADPQHASVVWLPVVVHLEVCTLQLEGEPFDATMDRAIRAHRMIPLYLWPTRAGTESKPITDRLRKFLYLLPRIRVEDIDEGLAAMQVCPICCRRTSIGAQILLLPCHHAFHSHCVVRRLEDDNLCPVSACRSPAYDLSFRRP